MRKSVYLDDCYLVELPAKKKNPSVDSNEQGGEASSGNKGATRVPEMDEYYRR